MTWRRARTYALVMPVIAVLLLLGPELMTIIMLAGGDAAAIELLLVVWALSVCGAVASLPRLAARLASRILRIIRKPAPVRGQMRASRLRRKNSQKGRKEDEPAPDWRSRDPAAPLRREAAILTLGLDQARCLRGR